jgi:hypothetical protein
MPALAIWTGGPMNAADALDTLRRDGFPSADITVVLDRLPYPTYERRGQESGDLAQARFDRAVETFRAERAAQLTAAAGRRALQLIAEDAASRSFNAEWRDDKGNERAVFDLATEYGRRFPAGLAYVIGTREQLVDVAQQSVLNAPGVAQAVLPPGAKVWGYLDFMATRLALFAVENVAYPVIVSPGAYAVGVYAPERRMQPDADENTVTVGIMPLVNKVGVVGASAERVMADLKATLEADAPPTFDPLDFKTRLRLRRKLAAGSDNP